jgi:hypothetical protein
MAENRSGALRGLLFVGLALIAGIGLALSGCGDSSGEPDASQTTAPTQVSTSQTDSVAVGSDRRLEEKFGGRGRVLAEDPKRDWQTTDKPPVIEGVELPPAPEMKAHRVGDQVIVKYRLRGAPRGNLRPVTLLTSVDPAGNRVPPLTIEHAIKGRRGRVTQPIGLGDPPFIVRVATVAKSGLTSQSVEFHLR